MPETPSPRTTGSRRSSGCRRAPIRSGSSTRRSYSQRLDTVRGIIDRGKSYSFRNRAVEAYLSTDWPHVR
ncbi:hypothetical protein DEJ23_09190 [Curtobacterium sp. MCSS17_008]|nr:hypothetical protein DEJ23_09190 [Curtobacterium sp. MCSS17_008]